MRGALITMGLLASGSLAAQDWALLNPAYRYNYSDDGTDTISNQIRVMHIDTLGPDSFRYELNRIAAICDTCTSPGLFVLLDEPQFMQRHVDVGPNTWRFHGPGSMVIRPNALIGEVWTFDTLAGVTAMIASEIPMQLFGNDAQVRVISLSNGSSITFSDSLGIVSWDEHSLIGAHGPELGQLIPSLQQIFPYQVGDAVEYFVQEGGYDGIGTYSGSNRRYKFTVDSGAQVGNAIEYSGQYTEHRWEWADPSTGPMYTLGHQTTIATTWTAGAPELPWSELQVSYPGQLVRGRVVPDMMQTPDTVACIARHWLSATGEYMIGCTPVAAPIFAPDGMVISFRLPEPLPVAGEPVSVAPVGYYSPDAPEACGPRYKAGVGFEYYGGCYFEWGESYTLTGSVINGDTTGAVHTDEWIIALSLSEQSENSAAVLPNPASDRILLTHAPMDVNARIHDLGGRMVLTHHIISQIEAINVQGIAPGVYLLNVDGMAPQRFIIAR